MSSYAEFEEEKIPIECPICYTYQTNVITLSDCYHTFCVTCFTQYLETLINEAKISNIGCPTCSSILQKATIFSLISKEIQDKYDKFSLRENLINNPYARLCPVPDCEGYAMGNLKNKKLTCNICKFEYCFFCVEKWHGSRKCEKNIDEDFERWVVGNNVKFCPKCKRRVEKRGGCPNMTCVCGHSWCWRCGGSPGEPGHGARCLLGKDIWNVNKTVINFLIFAPILVYFIPAIFIIVLLDVLNEGEETVFMIRNRRYFYPLLIILSPVLEIFGAICLIFALSFLLAERISKTSNILSVPSFFLGIIIFSFVVVTGIGLAIVLSFIGCIVGIGLFVLRVVGRFTGKEKSQNEYNFYPHVFD